MTMTLTLSDARKQLAAVGITITNRDEEYRVNYQGGSEESAAYYSEDDLEGALATGKTMAKWKAETTERFGADWPELKGTGPVFVPTAPAPVNPDAITEDSIYEPTFSK